MNKPIITGRSRKSLKLIGVTYTSLQNISLDIQVYKLICKYLLLLDYHNPQQLSKSLAADYQIT